MIKRISRLIIIFIAVVLCLSGEGYSYADESQSDYVALGKNGFLFYTRTDDGDPIGCYQGTNLYNEEELKALAENCTNQRDLLREENRELIILILPNKERIYHEYMPDEYGRPAENYRALQVYNYLKEHTDITVVYPYHEMMQAKTELNVPLWYKTDTHWNAVGAYIGASALLKELGIPMPAITDEGISILTGNPVAGDLAAMLNLSEKPDVDYIIQGYDTHNLKASEWDAAGVFIFHSTDSDPRKLYVVRDSFASQLAPYVASQFEESYWRHIFTYTREDMEEQDPDVVVFETAERYVGNLNQFTFTSGFPRE